MGSATDLTNITEKKHFETPGEASAKLSAEELFRGADQGDASTMMSHIEDAMNRDFNDFSREIAETEPNHPLAQYRHIMAALTQVEDHLNDRQKYPDANSVKSLMHSAMTLSEDQALTTADNMAEYFEIGECVSGSLESMDEWNAETVGEVFESVAQETTEDCQKVVERVSNALDFLDQKEAKNEPISMSKAFYLMKKAIHPEPPCNRPEFEPH